MIKPASARKIICEVAAETGVKVEDIIGPRRFRTMFLARERAIKRIRNETRLSQPQIGQIFGRDHTTIWHAIHKGETQ